MLKFESYTDMTDIIDMMPCPYCGKPGSDCKYNYCDQCDSHIEPDEFCIDCDMCFKCCGCREEDNNED